MSSEKEKQAESRKAASAQNGQGESSDQTQVAATDTETEKVPESNEQVDAPKAAATPDMGDEAGKQVEAAQTGVEPEKVHEAQQHVKGKTPEETLRNYLAKLNAIDTIATVKEDASTQEQGTEAKSEPTDKAIESQEIHWLEDVINDLTPVLVIQAHQVMDQGELLGDRDLHSEMERFNLILSDKSKTNQEIAERAKNLLHRFSSHCNIADHTTKAIFADYAIMMGKSLLALKEFVKVARKTDANLPQWSVWAEANLGFLSERRRQEYMSLAKRTDAHEFTYLGIDRLLHLIRATEGMSGDKRIENFLDRYNIRFNPEDEEQRINEFKYEVDAALALHRAEELEVTLDFAKIKTLLQVGGDVDRKLLADFALISKTGADPNDYVDILIRNRGKRVDFFKEENLVELIINLFSRLGKGIDKLIADPNTLRKLAISEIEPLESRIANLRATLGSLPPAAIEEIPPHSITLLSRLEKGLDKLMADPNTMKKLAISQLEPLESRIASLKATLTGPPPAAKEDSPPPAVAATEDSPAATENGTPPASTK
ncbi:MAG: hypothetical protein ABSG91_12545 [Syntrophobacteraceae bacterium]|jgi:hypothetical protein